MMTKQNLLRKYHAQSMNKFRAEFPARHQLNLSVLVMVRRMPKIHKLWPLAIMPNTSNSGVVIDGSGKLYSTHSNGTSAFTVMCFDETYEMLRQAWIDLADHATTVANHGTPWI